MENIITSLIAAGIPAVVTIITHFDSRRLSKLHSAKQSILQMILEDEFNVETLHKLPCNYKNIHYEYDEYKKQDGNSDIDIKMKEYESWYKSIK